MRAVSTCVAIATLGIVVSTAPPASAKEVPYLGSFATREECVSVQSTYRRYYKIVKECYDTGFLAWTFTYDNGR